MQALAEYLRYQTYKYLKNNPNLKSLVLGVSGGVDSALVAALVKPVCDELKIKLIGRSLPSKTNKPDEISRADMVGVFCHEFFQDSIDNLFEAFATGLISPSKIRLGNLKARIRMILLYDMASERQGMVLSTDNKTEESVGFWTLHGDVGDFALIQNLWKTEVYQLSDWLVKNELKTPLDEALSVCINAIPTDGLGVSSSDLEQFGVSSYNEVDGVLKRLVYNNDIDLSSPVIQRHFRTEFKRNNPFNVEIPRLEDGTINL